MRIPKIRLPSQEKRHVFILETALIGGFLMLGYGIYCVFPPAAFIISGILLMVFGFFGIGGGRK